MATEEKLYTEEEAAKFLNIPKRTLENWRYRPKEHCPKFTKVGRAVRYREIELIKFLERRTTK